MRRGIIAVAAVLSLLSAVPAFAVDGSQPPQETGINFEQMRSDHLRKLDERINSLKQEKTCVQAAKNQDDLRACRAKHRAEMKDRGHEMRKRGPGGPGAPLPPEGK
ncbi:MAG: hypothetical protein H6R42_14 [Nitrospirae bacterium]|jgi:predicted S18 family serine protease|nr:hypothetical protein [Nitrospirota bacterium]MBS1232360.1 hypothetical protein [Nitrospirota bacterium]